MTILDMSDSTPSNSVDQTTFLTEHSIAFLTREIRGITQETYKMQSLHMVF